MGGRHDPSWWEQYRAHEQRQQAEQERRRLAAGRQLSIFDTDDDQEHTEPCPS